MAKRPGKYGKKITNSAEDQMLEGLDGLSEFEEFMEKVPSELRKAIKEGASAQELFERFSSHAAVRAILIATTDPDNSKALSAAKDVLDRAQGKATERKEVSHKFDQLPDEELDAVLASELESLSEQGTSEEPH